MSEPKQPGVEEASTVYDADYDKRSAAADADAAAGRVVPHEEVAKWLASWGTPNETPLPKSWRR
ncbi:antitoxin [Caulobacter mirabilis]|uniref:antitoxin n=1 Tax=Caulobacter mirabilis TaxID=69666 RepID=UPI001C0EDD84|nr:antitoxin [Caulobacter mirabilis]